MTIKSKYVRLIAGAHDKRGLKEDVQCFKVQSECLSFYKKRPFLFPHLDVVEIIRSRVKVQNLLDRQQKWKWKETKTISAFHCKLIDAPLPPLCLSVKNDCSELRLC